MNSTLSTWIRFSLIMALLATLLTGCSRHTLPTERVTPNQDVTRFVDPFVGTGGKGKTYPGATLPYGMVQLSPDNGRHGWDWIAGYYYPDNQIAGFSHTHLSGTGVGDLFDISFMPFSGQEVVDWDANEAGSHSLASPFSHEKENAAPGYYHVYLPRYGIHVELTAGLRTGLQRYTYSPDESQPEINLNLGYSRGWDRTTATHIQVMDAYSISGYRKSTGWAKDQRVYFYSRFSQPIDTWSLTVDGDISSVALASGTNINARFTFALPANQQIEVRTSISSVSMENAELNFQADQPTRSFDVVRQAAKQSWQSVLGKIQVDASPDNKKQFYTALYHSYLAPRIFSDAKGQYKGPDGNIHQSTQRPRYSFFSLWDTFRALHPWKTIIEPAVTTEMMHSLLAHYEEYGLLPVWNFQGNETDMMIGYHAVPVVVDAYLKGLFDVEGEYLLAAVKKSAMQDAFGIGEYKKLGYVPCEYNKWSVSLTLEYAFDDWSIAQLAQALNKQDDYQYFLNRSQAYLALFDSKTGFLRAKNRKGEFRLPFDSLAYDPEDYCEANAWPYYFFVPQDIQGLIDVSGGPKNFEKKLDDLFTIEQREGKLPEWISGSIGQYVHGNEPAHHIPYLYQYVGRGEKTQRLVRQIMDTLYSTKPVGLCGNEDAGQLSAWYLFSALGFYPVNPVSGQYVLGSPEVNRATIFLEGGASFTVVANNQSAENVLVDSVWLNGKPLDRYYITHQEIMQGGKLVFNMKKETP